MPKTLWQGYRPSRESIRSARGQPSRAIRVSTERGELSLGLLPPSFGAQIKKVEQPDAEFPDVIVEMANGTFIDFELGEWLDGGQMAAAKRYDARAEVLIDTLGAQGANPSRHSGR